MSQIMQGGVYSHFFQHFKPGERGPVPVQKNPFTKKQRALDSHLSGQSSILFASIIPSDYTVQYIVQEVF